MARQFFGSDDEVSWYKRGIQAKDVPAVKFLTDLDAFNFMLKDYTTIVVGVEECRLFDSNNQEGVRLRFPPSFFYSEQLEEKTIKENHRCRLKIIHAITASPGSPTLKTVSFIPGCVDHIQFGSQILMDRWRKELSEFCNNIHRNKNLRNLHIATELSDGEGFDLEQLLKVDSLVELSLPNLRDEGWRNLALGLRRNRGLKVLTIVWDTDGVKTLMETLPLHTDYDSNVTWTECNEGLESLVITCPKDFDLSNDAQSVAKMLYRVSCVYEVGIDYWPPEQARLSRFARYLQVALTESKNVETLHLRIPFDAKGVEEVIRPLIPGIDGQQPNDILTSLFLNPDRLNKVGLRAVADMISRNTTLTSFGFWSLYSKKKPTIWRYLHQGICEQDIIDFLTDVLKNTSLQSLSFRGWLVVDGRRVLNAVLDLLRRRPSLHIDLTGTGLAQRDMLVPVFSQLQKNKNSMKSSTSRASNHCSRSSPPVSEPASSLIQQSSAGADERAYGTTSSNSQATSSRSGSRLFTQESLNDHYHREPTLGSASSAPTPTPTPTTIKAVAPVQAIEERPTSLESPRVGLHAPLFFSKFTYEELKAATNGFKQSLGEGGFGVVYKGTLINGTDVAIKNLKLLNISKPERDRIEKSFGAEVHTLGLFHHVNLVRLLGYCVEDSHHMLVYEYMPNSSLERWLFGDDLTRALDWDKRKNIAIGIARGLEYLHKGCSQGVVHLDVKPQNILLDSALNPKLADFGVARLVEVEQTLVSISVAQGTQWYMAPEMHTSFSVSAKTDVYSFGILLLEIIRGKRNANPKLQDETKRFFPGWAKQRIRRNRFAEVINELNTSISIISQFQREEARTLLCIALFCITDEMEKRPTMDMVLHMLEGRMDVPDPSPRLRRTMSSTSSNQ